MRIVQIVSFAWLAATPGWAQPERYKAIFEPVNFKADVQLRGVYFASDDAGWVAGGPGGMILHTKDGGQNWSVQYGDPQSSDREVTDLFFLDATHGWAVQGTGASDSNLLHTTDGINWAPTGIIGTHRVTYSFSSERQGTYIDRDTIYHTTDGGTSWRPVARCVVDAEVEGLTRKVKCGFHAMHFPAPSIGYTAGTAGGVKGFFVFKTTDGGATWHITPAVSEGGDAGDVRFTSPDEGFIRIGFAYSGRLHRTRDGGKTWTPVAASPGDRMLFPDPEVGWAFREDKLGFTVNGGASWTSRTVRFPAGVNDMAMPSRHRAYVVGEHGMVYRYRIVPAAYTAPKILDAPMMPVRPQGR